MKKNKTRLIFLIPIVICIVSVGWLIARSSRPEDLVMTGIVETNEIDVASKIPGRIDSIFIDEGDVVHKGQVIAALESKEMQAKLEQARGVMEAAKSKMKMAHNGARPEEKEAVGNQYSQAVHQFDLAEKTWTRIQSLYKDQVISLQEKDQVEFQYQAAKEQRDAAKAKYEMVIKGTRFEEIEGAEALYHQAENTYNEALAYFSELKIVSPADGEVSKRISDPGEIIASGYPVFTIINPAESYVVLQVREDQMAAVSKGKSYLGKVPALGNEEFEFIVKYIAPMADFATWKATNQKGDFDLKTFEVHLYPAAPVENLRPGMTVNLKVKGQKVKGQK